MQRIAPMLWYDDDAEEAAQFYCSIFKNSKITGKSSYGEGGPGPKGQVMIVTFELDGQEFTALNGGPRFPSTEARDGLLESGMKHGAAETFDRLAELLATMVVRK